MKTDTSIRETPRRDTGKFGGSSIGQDAVERIEKLQKEIEHLTLQNVQKDAMLQRFE